jgi:hypothetical protein
MSISLWILVFRYGIYGLSEKMIFGSKRDEAVLNGQAGFVEGYIYLSRASISPILRWPANL